MTHLPVEVRQRETPESLPMRLYPADIAAQGSYRPQYGASGRARTVYTDL